MVCDPRMLLVQQLTYYRTSFLHAPRADRSSLVVVAEGELH